MSHYRRKPGKWAVFTYTSYFDRWPSIESRHRTEEAALSAAMVHDRWQSVHRIDRVRTVPDYGLVFDGAPRANGLQESDVFG